MPNERKTEFIEAVQKAASFWDASATSAAITAVNSSYREDAAEAMANAREALARSHSAQKLRDEVIQLAHRYWPEQ